MERKDCRACGSLNIECFLDFGFMPLAGGFLKNKNSEDNLYDLKINFCHDCSLIQISNVVDPDIMFQDYSFSSSTVKPLHDHFENYAQWLVSKTKGLKYFEFGCNDGILLDKLEKLNMFSVGIDPSINITDIAKSKNLNVITGYFGESSVNEIVKNHGKFDVVSGSNVFAHNNDPGDILNSANIILNDDGFISLEVMYAYDLLSKFQWDTLYHEHLTFYSLHSIKRLLNMFGFYLIDAERIPMHGGSLRILASKNKNLTPNKSVDKLLKLENEIQLNTFATWKVFGLNAKKKISIVKTIYNDLSVNNNIWAYGAAGKSTLWVNACEMNYLNGVIDASPLRAGKFMPGTKTEIFFPEKLKSEKVDIIFITAWNYRDNIVKNEPWFKGQWSTPLPDLSFF